MAAPLTGAARQQAWTDALDSLVDARWWGRECVTNLDGVELRAVILAGKAGHHANRALDLLAQLTAEQSDGTSR